MNKEYENWSIDEQIRKVEQDVSLSKMRQSFYAENTGKHLTANAMRAMAKQKGITPPKMVCANLQPCVFYRSSSKSGDRFSFTTPQSVKRSVDVEFQDGFSFAMEQSCGDMSKDTVDEMDGIVFRPMKFYTHSSKSSRIVSNEVERFATYSTCMSRAESMVDYCDVCRRKYATQKANFYLASLYQMIDDYGESSVRTYLLTFTISDQFADGWLKNDGNWIDDTRLLLSRFDKEVLQPWKKRMVKLGYEVIYMFCCERGTEKSRLHFHACITLSKPMYGVLYFDKLHWTQPNTYLLPTAKEFYAKYMANWKVPWTASHFSGDTPSVARRKDNAPKEMVYRERNGHYEWCSQPIVKYQNCYTPDEWALAYDLYSYWRYGVLDVQLCVKPFASAGYIVKYVLKDSLEHGSKPTVKFSYGMLKRVFEKNAERLATAKCLEDIKISTGKYNGQDTYTYCFPQYYREKYLSFLYRKSLTDDKVVKDCLTKK